MSADLRPLVAAALRFHQMADACIALGRLTRALEARGLPDTLPAAFEAAVEDAEIADLIETIRPLFDALGSAKAFDLARKAPLDDQAKATLEALRERLGQVQH